jgi:hypothetical protein
MAQAAEGESVCPHIEEQKLFCEPDKTRHLTELGRITVSSVACSTKPHAW